MCDTVRMTTPEETREHERAALEEASVSRIRASLDSEDFDEAFSEGQLIGEVSQISTSPLNVYVDVIDLLDHLDGDEAKLWEFLGKLKDLFA